MQNSQIQNPDGKANKLMSDNPENPAEALELEPRVPTATDTLTLDAEAQLQELISSEASLNYFSPLPPLFSNFPPPGSPHRPFLGVYIHFFQDSASVSAFEFTTLNLPRLPRLSYGLRPLSDLSTFPRLP